MSSETGNGKKKKIAASAAAVALAAALMIGGTLSYLKSASEEVENTFTANTDYVSLSESDNDYQIIPGTSQTKDPTITYASTVETYVFVEVTDATDGLVEWAIADGWTLLTSSTDEDGVTTYVYYQIVDATGYDEDGDLVTKTLQVLKDDTVSYSAELDNDDMLEAIYDEDGNLTGYTLKDDLTLSFKAYTIQTASLDDPAVAYAYATGSSTSVSTSDALSSALSSGHLYHPVI